MIYKPDHVLSKALEVFPTITTKAKYGYVVDYGVDANNHRFFVIDIAKEEIIYSWYTSHGSGSGSLLRATEFSNVPNSHKSSLGRVKTAETYYSSKFGYALRLDGLDKGVNDKMRARAIVMHQSDYVRAAYIANKKYAGRSQGCVTLNPPDSESIINRLKGGSPGLHIYK